MLHVHVWWHKKQEHINMNILYTLSGNIWVYLELYLIKAAHITIPIYMINSICSISCEDKIGDDIAAMKLVYIHVANNFACIPIIKGWGFWSMRKKINVQLRHVDMWVYIKLATALKHAP